MKKILFSTTIALALFASCTSDDSQYGVDGKGTYINISGLEKSYDVVSFSGDELDINPTIQSSYGDGDLVYTWYVYDKNAQGTYNSETESYDYPTADTLSHDKNFALPINLSDGQYVLVYQVASKTTGYTQTTTTTINAASALSKGFYILKETTDGNTDMDLYSTTTGKVVPDVLKNYQGASMSGKPRSFDVAHGIAYLNPETDKAAGCNAIFVTTETNEAQWIRALDMTTIMTPENCHYETVAGEIPYRMVRGYFSEYYVTSSGVYNCYSYATSPSSGLLGAYDGIGGSKYVVNVGSGGYYGIFYYSNETTGFGYIDYNGAAGYISSTVSDYSADYTGCDCIASGYNNLSKYCYFLMQDKNDASKKYLYALAAKSYGYSLKLMSVTPVDASSHYANASHRAMSWQDAAIAYSVDGNKIYSYDLSTGAEEELSFTGLPSNEEITYLSNRTCYVYATGLDFDYLIVGTQSGNTYKLYFYTTVGGKPKGEPAFTITGTGKLKGVDYIDSNVSDMMDTAAYCVTLDV